MLESQAARFAIDEEREGVFRDLGQVEINSAGGREGEVPDG